jgi:surface protein
MKPVLYYILLILICLPSQSFEQDSDLDQNSFNSLLIDVRHCGTMESLERLKKSNPGIDSRMKKIEEHTRNFMNNGYRQVNGVITIPVVVHVVYNTPAQNISDAQIQSQIEVLNKDFRRLNADADGTWPQADDMEIEFVLAQTDPNGNATNGITRTATTVTTFDADDSMKFDVSGGKDAWPAEDYLNIWVSTLPTTSSGTILGYAQFPGGPPETDGVVVNYLVFGTIGTAVPPFNLGRTTTHEVGHYLNLRHTWGDGDCSVDDFVSDTPLSSGPNSTDSPCTFPGPNSCIEPVNDQPDMFQNYMDYSTDPCKNLFTNGQKVRMRALFAPGGFRESLLSSLGNNNPDEFVTTWKTNNPGTSADNQITIPTTGSGYNYTVDWGDGNMDTGVTGNITHTYASAGTYQVSISGTFPRIFFDNGGDKEKIISIDQWGNIQWTSMLRAFFGCSNLVGNASDIPDLSMVTEMNSMFNGSSFNQDIGNWDLSNVQNIAYMFANNAVFNQDISGWNVSNVTDMTRVFRFATSFNQDLSSWNVGMVISMERMFGDATSFDQNLGNWNVSNVTNMTGMFENIALSQANYDATLIGWEGLPSLQNTVVFDAGNSQYCLSGSRRANMINTFNWTITDGGPNCSEGGFITTWKTDNPGSSAFNQITIPTTGTGYEYSIDWGDGQANHEVFGSITHTYALPGTYTVSIKGNFPRIFFAGGGDRQKIISIDQWGDIQWTSMSEAFNGCNNLTYNAVDVPELILVTATNGMFVNCNQFNGDLSGWDVSNVSNMGGMFVNCNQFNGNVTTWNTSSATTMEQMFAGANNFNRDIGNWNVSNVSNFKWMFSGTSSFDQDLSNWNISSATTMEGMFDGVTLSTTNYDRMLINWSNLPVQNNVLFSGGNSRYCNALNARATLEITYNWTITDGGGFCGDGFVTKWDTRNVGSSGNTIEIPTLGSGYNYYVDWGDGFFNTNVTGNISHTYVNPGMYTVTIVGDFPRIYFNNTGDKEKILSVEQWGDIEWASMEEAFNGCTNLQINASDVPNLSLVTSLAAMFAGATNFNQNISGWDVSNVVNMRSMFNGASSFNQNINSWDVSNVVYMQGMFQDAISFNSPIGNWDVSNVTQMWWMFRGATSFNQNLSGWNVSQVISIRSMFENTSFNQDISSWDVSNVIYMGALFFNTPFSQDIGSWDVSNVTEMQALFGNANSFDQDISSWDVSNVTNFKFMFSGASSFNQDISVWNTSAATEMTGMFQNAVSFNQDIGIWNVGAVTEMIAMFQDAVSFNQDISGWDVSMVTLMNRMFDGAGLFNQDISMWDVSKVTYMEGMFQDAVSFNQDISGWDVSQVTGMSNMFNNALSFDQELGSWDIRNVTQMLDMFENVTLSRDNYDNLLIGWSKLPVQSGVIFDGGNSMYCLGEHARNILGWNIMDGGLDCSGVFITRWFTSVEGSPDNSITIPTIGSGYDYSIAWSNGYADTHVTGNITTNFSGPNGVTAKISGNFPRIFFNNTGDKDKLLSVEQWGDNEWTSMELAFHGCSNLEINATDAPDLSNVTSMRGMFAGAASLNQDVRLWNTSNVEDFSFMFSGASSFNQDISIWNTSSATNMSAMFQNATSFNQAIGMWNTSNVEDISFMFEGATSFNQDISAWNVSKVHSMLASFQNASSFNQPLNTWDMSMVTTMKQMFYRASVFNQDLPTWNVNMVSDMSFMFMEATAFNGNISAWNTGAVTNMFSMFKNAVSFNGDISGWSTAGVNSFESMFEGSTSFNQDIGGWDLGGSTELDKMFYGATSFDQNLGTWDIAHITSMDSMFTDAQLSEINYDALLRSWYFQTSVYDVKFDAGNSKFCTSRFFKDGLTRFFGWDIKDGGRGCPDAFVTTWNTLNFGTSNDNQITIPTEGTGYNYSINWGDGSFDHNVTGDITHTYATSGTYGIAITGDFPRIYFNMEGDAIKLESIDQWGNIAWTSMKNAFAGCYKVKGFASDAPNLSNVSRMDSMFADANSFNQDLNNWDVSTVTKMEYMFLRAGTFNGDISTWNTGNVTNMEAMFAVASQFNQNLNDWDVSSVTNMKLMFAYADNFNGNIAAWDVINVTNMQEMFYNAKSFNGFLYFWDVDNVTNMALMFAFAESFNGSLPNWNTSNVTNMSGMFGFATSFNQYINNWDVSNVNNMEAMFQGASSFNQDLSLWNIGNVANLRYTFYEAVNFNGNISTWNTSSVTSMSHMLGKALSFDQNLGSWDVSNVTDMENMFQDVTLSTSNYDNILIGWSQLPNLNNGVNFNAGNSTYCAGSTYRMILGSNYGWIITDGGNICTSNMFISRWNTQNFGISNDNQVSIPSNDIQYTVHWGDGTSDVNVNGPITHTYTQPGVYTISMEDLDYLVFNFSGDRGKILSIDQWGSGIWTSMENAFRGCLYLQVLASDSPDLSAITSLRGMFEKVSNFNSNIDSWDVSSISDMSRMFYEAYNFNQPLNSWNVGNVTDMSEMFYSCRSFNQSLNSWDVSSVQTMQSMFYNARAFNGNISEWNVSSVVNMNSLFRQAIVFNQNIGAWNVSSVITMSSMFNSAVAFNQDLNSWNVENLEDMSFIFNRANSFNGNISSWNVSKVTLMNSAFASALEFNHDITSWDVSSVNNLENMFIYASSFNQNLGSWNIGNVSNLSGIFTGTALSSANYDQILIGWANLPSVQNNIFFRTTHVNYCLGAFARSVLENTYGWTIIDGGPLPGCCSEGETIYSGGAWTNGNPTENKAAIFNDNYTTSTHGGSIDACGVTINPGVTLTIEDGDYLNLKNELMIKGILILKPTGTINTTNN